MKKNNEPKLWVTVLKLVAGAAILIGGVGGALWLASKSEKTDTGVPQSNTGWGISTDSPIRSNR
jgi:hypothetical protein